MEGKEFLIYSVLSNVPQQVLFKKVQVEKEKILCRPLDHIEYQNAQRYINGEISMDQLLMLCQNRTKESLDFLIKYM